MEGEIQRNELGDIILPDKDFDWGSPEFKYWERTYVFEYYDAKLERFVPCFDILRYENATVESARSNIDFLEVDIHAFPLEMIYRDQMIYHRNFEEAILNTFFGGVFKPRHPAISSKVSTKYSRLLMKRSHYDQILNFIHDAGLLPFRDLFLEIIANGQELFLEFVFYANEKSLKKKINTVSRNVKDLTEIFDLNTRPDSKVSISEKELKQPHFIHFAFNHKQFKISDYFLISDLINSYKTKLDNSEVKNWRYTLQRFSHIYDDEIQELKFRERYINSIYELLKYFNKIGNTGKLTNENLRLVDKLAIFSGIYAGGLDEGIDVRIKHIRNWIKRNKFEQKENAPDLSVDKEILNKYFDKDFLDLPINQIIDEEAGGIAGFLLIRFGLEKRKFEIVYIVKCLTQVIWFIMDQVSSGLLNRSEDPSKFENYKTFVESISSGKGLSSAVFYFNDTTISLNDDLPLKIITDALKHYHQKFKEEVESDIIQSHIIKELNNGQNVYNLNQKSDFKKPKDQFVVHFVGQMYQFLLNEFPPDKHEHSPRIRYYSIIAHMLIKTHYFRDPQKDEDIALQQVANWHKLSISP